MSPGAEGAPVDALRLEVSSAKLTWLELDKDLAILKVSRDAAKIRKESTLAQGHNLLYVVAERCCETYVLISSSGVLKLRGSNAKVVRHWTPSCLRSLRLCRGPLEPVDQELGEDTTHKSHGGAAGAADAAADRAADGSS